ncbi:DNA repair protein RadA [Candidatus Woesebacteria bacterium]|nr:DNA repair protein RadA [Candidatus Woesebacteria bacterium]
MAKIKTQFVCQNCGQAYPRWTGQCPNCSEWNTLVEEIVEAKSTKIRSSAEGVSGISFSQVDLFKASKRRIPTGVGELDRVLGGEKDQLGMVAGAVMLIGGEPGIGKSTLLTQVVLEQVARISQEETPQPIVYVCGEESPTQIALRINRILEHQTKKIVTAEKLENLVFLANTDVDVVVSSLAALNPCLVVVDSIQTMTTGDLSGVSGSVGQVRESTERLTHAAKKQNFPLFLVGHVTKEGQLAGPKVLEHIVDAVLELNGERTSDLRLIRTIKNRFGATDEVGVLQLSEAGFISVTNPSSLFLEHQAAPVPGSATVCVLEGTRPLLLEVQALAVRSQLPMPRRIGRGVDVTRIQVISAILQKYCRMPLDSYDLFVNLAGGYSTKEPGLDLGIAMAIASSVQNKPVPAQTVFIGEVGLLGEIRQVNLLERRIKESKRLGFEHNISKSSHTTVQKVIQSFGL